MFDRSRKMRSVRKAAAVRRLCHILPGRKPLCRKAHPAPENITAKRDAKLLDEEMPEAIGRKACGAGSSFASQPSQKAIPEGCETSR